MRVVDWVMLSRQQGGELSMAMAAMNEVLLNIRPQCKTLNLWVSFRNGFPDFRHYPGENPYYGPAVAAARNLVAD